MTDEILEEAFDGIEFATNTLEGIVTIFEFFFEAIEVGSIDIDCLGYAIFAKIFDKLIEIFGVG